MNKQEIVKLTQYLIHQLVKLNKNRQWKEISIVITDNKKISLVNLEHLAKEGATDVISFCFEPMPGDKGLFTGEVIVNVQRAIDVLANAKKRDRWNASRELALYIAHGCDHLLDECDYDPAGRKRMRRRELRWLKNAAELNLIDDLITIKG